MLPTEKSDSIRHKTFTDIRFYCLRLIFVVIFEISMEHKAKKKNTEEKNILHKKKVDSHFFRKFAVLIRKFLKTVRNLRIANPYFAPCDLSVKPDGHAVFLTIFLLMAH